jgi:hypothetical protein
VSPDLLTKTWILNRMRGYVLVLSLNTDTGTYREIGKYRGAELISSVLFCDLQVAAATLLEPD